ncbi:MAG: glycosidase [Flavobacteriales bacterium]|jgi:glycosidase
MKLNRSWWKEGIVYQIYPRSFKDTSGNGNTASSLQDGDRNLGGGCISYLGY